MLLGALLVFKAEMFIWGLLGVPLFEMWFLFALVLFPFALVFLVVLALRTRRWGDPFWRKGGGVALFFVLYLNPYVFTPTLAYACGFYLRAKATVDIPAVVSRLEGRPNWPGSVSDEMRRAGGGEVTIKTDEGQRRTAYLVRGRSVLVVSTQPITDAWAFRPFSWRNCLRLHPNAYVCAGAVE